jgi:hypothetical protein
MAWQCKIGIHDYEWSYDYPYSCDQTGRCRRKNCDHSSTRILHRFGEWEYQSPTDCEKRRYCERNTDHFEDQAPSHQWGEPNYVSSGSCLRIYVCERNPQHTKTSTDHMWGPPVLSENCNLISRCTRCPDGIDHVGKHHNFLPVEQINVESGYTNKTLLIRQCRNCSYSEREEIS